MVETLCIPALYLYQRESLPHSQRWYLHDPRKQAEKPSLLAPGIMDVNGGGDYVAILIAVPCGETGEVDPDTQEEYEDLADKKFEEFRPGAELA